MMPNRVSRCLDDEVIARLADGDLAASELEPIEVHVDGCPTCRSLVVAIGAGEDDREGDALPWLRNGDRIGRYQIRGWLGAGGMGQVFRARDETLDREVALKLVGGEATAGAHKRLVQEARAMASLTHPNVASVFDAGEINGRAFIAMELIEGTTLAEWVRCERPDRQQLIGAFIGAARGLAAAHQQGLLHRDFKPANVLVDRGGWVRVSDFGLAARPGGAELCGTAAYIAPECASGSLANERSDIYSFGVALAECIELGGISDPKLAAVADRASAADPADRYDAIDDMLAALARLRVRRRRYVELAVLAALAALAIALWSRTGDHDLIATVRGGITPRSFELSIPANREAARHLAEAEQMNARGARAAARASADLAIAAAPDHPRPHLARARALSDRPAEARQAATRAAELARGDLGPERKFYRAWSLAIHGKHTEAIELLVQLGEYHPGSYEINRALAESLASHGDRTLARKVYGRLEPQSDIDVLEVLARRAELDMLSHRYPASLRLARRLDERAQLAGERLFRSRAQLLISQAERHLHKPDQALASARLAVALAREAGSPLRTMLAEWQAISLLMHRERYSEALDLLDKHSETLRLVAPEQRRLAMPEIAKSQILADTGRTEEALELLGSRRIARLDSVYLESYARVVRSQLRRARGDLPGAIDDCSAGDAAFRALDNQRMVAFALAVCAEALLDAGALDEAAAANDESMAKRERLGLDLLVAQNRLARAELALAGRDPRRALAKALAAAELFAARAMRNDEASAREVAARAAWRVGEVDRAREEIAVAKTRREGESAQLAGAIGITEALVRGGKQAPAAIARHVAALRAAGYLTLAIEGDLARAAALRANGDRRRAAAVAASARAEAEARSIVPFRY
jgi:serine/threonine-protein kinase